MTGESDRIARASDYVLGLMNERDRERAERDLEIDPAFRNAVMQLAERMHLFDRAATQDANRPWQGVAARIAELPQMSPPGQGNAKAGKRIIDGPRQPVACLAWPAGDRHGGRIDRRLRVRLSRRPSQPGLTLAPGSTHIVRHRHEPNCLPDRADNGSLDSRFLAAR